MKQAEFERAVYEVVAHIPPGKVSTYGRIALLAGRPNGHRLSARALHYAPEGLPCHRVVNSQGRTAPGWAEQRTLLEREGVRFKENGTVDIKNFLWK